MNTSNRTKSDCSNKLSNNRTAKYNPNSQSCLTSDRPEANSQVHNKIPDTVTPVRPSVGRHERGCRICSHPSRNEIEEAFIAWRSPARIATEYGLRNRATVYRHAHALNLFPKRSRNIRVALERIIEKADEVPVNAAAVVQAIATYARINAQGNLIERSEQINLNDLFDRMSAQELEAYAKDGVMPQWFRDTTGATHHNSPETNNNG